MNGFIGALAAQLALKPVSPAADGIASRPRNAFPGAWRWRYVDVMRSQVSDDGDILPRRIQKRPRTGKGPLRGNVSPPCIQNELALARYACHVSEKPCKSPLEDTPREDPARKGPFSLRKPLESCTARRSCHDSAFARPCERKSRGAGYRKCTSYCGRRPHYHDRVRLRQPCAIMAAAALWPMAQTHDSQCCGERTVQRCVCASCPAASARTSSVGGAPRHNTKNGQRLLAVFARL